MMKRFLITLLLSLSTANADAALTQHWKLDETSGTTATATVGTSGTYARNASNTTYSATSPGSAILLSQDLVPASSDAVDISGASISFGAGIAFSASIWFRADALPMPLLGKGGSTNSEFRAHTTNKMQFTIGSSHEWDFTSVTTGVWYHVLLTRDTGNLCRVWLNGVESTTGSINKSGTVVFDRIGLSNATYADGKIAWVKIYNSDESANVATLYAEKDLATGFVPRVIISRVSPLRGPRVPSLLDPRRWIIPETLIGITP